MVDKLWMFKAGISREILRGPEGCAAPRPQFDRSERASSSSRRRGSAGAGEASAGGRCMQVLGGWVER